MYIGPTLGQRTSIFNKLLSKTKLAGIRWFNFGPTKCTKRNFGHVKTSRRCTLAQRWVNVAFSTTFIKNQSGRHTLVQCWPNVMHPTQLSHVKISHRCTLTQRWANILIPTSYRSDCQWQNVNVGAMLGQRCTSNPNHRPTVRPYTNVGPT